MVRSVVSLVCVVGMTCVGAWAGEAPWPATRSAGEPLSAPPSKFSPRGLVTAASTADKARGEAAIAKKLEDLPAPPPPKAGGAWNKRVVQRLSNAPASDVARTLGKLFEPEGGVLIVADPLSNSLLISAVPGALEEVQRLAKDLDRAPAMIRIEALVVELKLPAEKGAAGASPAPAVSGDDLETQLQALKKLGEVQVICRPAVMTLENQPAMLHIGSREPVIRSMQATGRGTTNTVTVENVGCLLRIVPRVSDEGRVIAQVELERSQVAPAEEGVVISAPTEGPPTRMPRTESRAVQSTVALADGQTARLAEVIVESKPRRTQMVLLATMSLVRDAKAK